MQAVHHLFRQLVTLLLVLVTLCGVVIWLLLDTQPLLTEQGQMNAESVRHSKQLLSNLNQSIRDQTSTQWVFAANTEELNSAFQLASRTWPGFQGRSEVNTAGLTTLLTMPLELPIGTYYLNARMLIRPSTGPLQIEQVQLGQLSLPGGMALTAVGWVADQVWGPGQGAQLLAMVRSVQFEQNAVKVEFAKPEGWSLQQLKESGLSAYRQFFSSEQQRADIEFYYRIANDFALQKSDASLVEYLQLLFRQAKDRTALYPEEPQRAQQENRAVLLAMAQLLGGKNLQMLVNEVKRPEGMKPPRVTLARRPDLQQHFLYSAAIQLLTTRAVSGSVGEAKELLDSIKGGSGFSFVDLLADRAGMKFADIATGSGRSAIALQLFFSQDRTEAELFPSKARLPEGIPQQLFEQTYQSVDSDIYRQMVQEIDRRLQELPLYQIEVTP
jgi:hypothetical protein